MMARARKYPDRKGFRRTAISSDRLPKSTSVVSVKAVGAKLSAKGLSASAAPATKPARRPQSARPVAATTGTVSVLAAMLSQRALASLAPKSWNAPASSQMKMGGLSGHTLRNIGSSRRKWSAQEL